MKKLNQARLYAPALRASVGRPTLCAKEVMSTVNERIIGHYISFFEGHEYTVLNWNLGPIAQVVPDFEVVRFSPGPKIGLWVYCSVGASTIDYEDSGRHEFLVVSPIESDRLVEMLAIITYYHSNRNLGFSHTLPIGKPWLEGSNCINWLISLPYPFGEELEILPLNGSHAHVAWLLPITDTEHDFKIKNGLEALEQLLMMRALNIGKLTVFRWCKTA